MKLIISTVSGLPLYEQIKDQLRTAILSGQLQAGEALPSLRTLARELRISVLTVTRAYNELAQEGIVENIQGKGTFVMESGSARMRKNLTDHVYITLKEAVKEAKLAQLPLAELHSFIESAYKDEK